ncbi:alpha/beta fold hydrolase [Brevibacterium sp. UCMA 11754]|uniref:alpha/beta fold hydrolase n=1 Tax=Brevibacterium sp. UCMA 11754 TaxID=2749198 RepID=UPI001F19FA0E|nr:alpha/beta hydrolase [Brevibacterium sp. UCMA 11754]MCF2572674.1 alpha/beta fold hydrolase [Brevibacterium sp. UCMA 11754]
MRDDNDVPVVLLHGVGLDRNVWQRVERLLRSPSVALDLPGHGTRPPLQEPTSVTEMTADVAARMPSGPVHLVGFSLGSLIAQQIALDHLERVRTLTCVSSVCARTEDESAAVATRLRNARRDLPASMETALQRWFPDDDGTDWQAQREETRPVLMANDPASYAHAYAVFATADRELADRLPAIAAPTLAMTGESDPGSTPEMSHRIAARVPDTEVVIVPGARHMLPVTHPEVLVGHLDHLIHQSERNQP